MFMSLFITVVSNDMSGFINNLNSEMKKESCETILDSGWFAVTLGGMFSMVLEWGCCEVRIGKEELPFIWRTKLIPSLKTSRFLTIEL